MRNKNLYLTVSIFLLPFVIFYTIFTVAPIFQGIYISFHKWGIMGSQSFLGLDNFIKAFHDKYFIGALKNTLIFVLYTVPSMLIVTFTLAYWANRKVGYNRILRISYYLPSVLSVSVISLLTVYMASPYTGFLNQTLQFLKIIPKGVEPQWLLNLNLVWITIVVATVWWTTGLSFLLFYAALQDIPVQLYEASDIDGATSTRKVFNITIPILKPTFLLVFFLQVIACFKVFGQIYLITGGGPANSTRPIIQYIYETAFEKNKFGYGSAMSYILFLILLIFTVLKVKFQNQSEV